MRLTARPRWLDRLAGSPTVRRLLRGGGAGGTRVSARRWVPDAGESRAGERYGGPASATRPIITLPPGGRGGGGAGSPGGPGRQRRFWLGLGLAAVVLVGLAGGYLIVAGPGGLPGGSSVGGAGPTPGKPEALTNCTANVIDAAGARRALESAKPGDRICLNGDLGNEELQLRGSGTQSQPITILGGGTATTGQITVRGDYVVVDGVRMNKPRSPGFMLIGNDITVRASLVDSPQVVKKGDDGDGIRFFGNDIKIVNNVIRNVVNLNGQKGNHGDAIQTFATSEENGPSQRVLIDGNRFEEIDNMCLIAEGPDSEAGDGTGEGRSSDFTVTNNYCDSGAGQAFFFDDISGVTLTGNEIAGKVDKAFSLQNDSTGATIRDNKIGPKVGYEVGMDDSSEDDYNGPEPEGGP